MLHISDTTLYFLITRSTNSLVPFVRHISVNSQQLTKEETSLMQDHKKAEIRFSSS